MMNYEMQLLYLIITYFIQNKKLSTSFLPLAHEVFQNYLCVYGNFCPSNQFNVSLHLTSPAKRQNQQRCGTAEAVEKMKIFFRLQIFG